MNISYHFQKFYYLKIPTLFCLLKNVKIIVKPIHFLPRCEFKSSEASFRLPRGRPCLPEPMTTHIQSYKLFVLKSRYSKTYYFLYFYKKYK